MSEFAPLMLRPLLGMLTIELHAKSLTSARFVAGTMLEAREAEILGFEDGQTNQKTDTGAADSCADQQRQSAVTADSCADRRSQAAVTADSCVDQQLQATVIADSCADRRLQAAVTADSCADRQLQADSWVKIGGGGEQPRLPAITWRLTTNEVG